VRRADNFTIFMRQLSWKLGPSNSWNLQGLSRPAQGLLYIYLYFSPTDRLPVPKTDSLPRSSADVIGLYVYAQGYTKSIGLHIYAQGYTCTNRVIHISTGLYSYAPPFFHTPSCLTQGKSVFSRLLYHRYSTLPEYMTTGKGSLNGYQHGKIQGKRNW